MNKLLFNKYIYSSFTISKRFAGHSKWANIKHTKQAKDHERMMLFHHLKQQMRVAINCMYFFFIVIFIKNIY